MQRIKTQYLYKATKTKWTVKHHCPLAILKFHQNFIETLDHIINPRHMRRRVTVVVLCVCVCVCLSVTKLTATYMYLVTKAWFVWIYLKMLCSPVLGSFADSKLLDFARAMTSHINITLCVARYIWYVRLLTLGACTLGTVAKIVHPRRLPRSVQLLTLVGWQCTWLLFNSKGMHA